MEQFSHKLANMFYDANIISSDAVSNYAFVTLTVVCVLVATLVSVCMADVNILSFGLLHGGNESHAYEQSYANVSASGESYNVTLSVLRNGVYYGSKTTFVGSGRTRYCTSYQVIGTGGTEAISIS